MNYLELYLDYSIKYKKIVGDNLNNDLKMIIWKKYKTLCLVEKLKKYIEKIIFRCEECLTARWFIINGIRQNFYQVNSCNNYIPGYDFNCCPKMICLNGCSFKIKCNMCYYEIRFIPEPKEYDIGWNPIEGKKILEVKCIKCNYINKKQLIWRDNCYS